jgi:hypothetical protein
MNNNDKLLFWGGLPPETIDGVTISNSINLKILSKTFQIDYIREVNTFRQHGKLSVFKGITFLKSSFSIIQMAYKTRYKFFYLVFSLSTFGGIKTLLAIVSFRLFNRGKIILHIHRGDLYSRFLMTRINKVILKLTFSLVYKIIVLSDSQKKRITGDI